MREYDLIAEWYASERLDQTGVPEAMALACALPPGARVLDIGCGNGIPITRALLSAGHRIVGLDSSREMLVRFRGNYPEVPAVRGIVQLAPFAERTFDAAVAWGVMFHLNQSDQMTAIASVSHVLKSGAPFLFTAGDVDGFEAKEDTMNGVQFRYWSFTIDDYRRVLSERGFTLSDYHEDGGKNGYYLAKKSA